MVEERNSGMRGVDFCRACGSTKLESVLDLGMQPLSNGLSRAMSANVEQFPLHMRICTDCWLGQLGEFATPEDIFEDYRYLSSMSTTWLEHAQGYAATMRSALNLNSDSLVVEVASNDGYLLRQFQALGMKVLGVEPAKNVAAIAEAANVPTISKFMSIETGQELFDRFGYADLIPANNVLAHVPDIVDFLSGISLLMDENTVLTVENPSMMGMLSQVQFDTIYHEHFSYLTATSVSSLCERNGLQLFHVEQLSTHGGSLRYWIRKHDERPKNISVSELLEDEERQGIRNLETYSQFREASFRAIESVKNFLRETKQNNEVVLGYGAAAKAVVLLNACDADSSDLPAVADKSHEKQGYFVPHAGIPIVSPFEMNAMNPKHVLIFPWNIHPEIKIELSQFLNNEVKYWICLPFMAEV